MYPGTATSARPGSWRRTGWRSPTPTGPVLVEADGLALAELDGLVDGDSDGDSDGDCDGDSDGDCDGDSDGDSDGEVVGVVVLVVVGDGDGLSHDTVNTLLLLLPCSPPQVQTTL